MNNCYIKIMFRPQIYQVHLLVAIDALQSKSL
jgi:hypothetical protein